MKCLALSRYPHSDPLLGTALTTAKVAEGWLSVFWQKKKKDFIATIECGKIRQKPRYTVNEVLLTKNSLRAPFVARNNSLLMLHWRPTLCGGKKKKKKHKVSHFYFYFCQKMELLVFIVTPFKIDQNKNQNRSIKSRIWEMKGVTYTRP